MRREESQDSVRALVPVVILALFLVPSSRAASNYKVLHQFTGADGTQPRAGLVFDSVGNLYGTTLYGGNLSSCVLTGFPAGCGTVFELSPNADGAWTETVIHAFSGPDGSAPTAGLTIDPSGNLYGVTLDGGSQGYGAVFELSRNPKGTWSETVLYSFQGSPDAAGGEGNLVFDSAGNLFGLAGGGMYLGSTCGFLTCGTIFELTPNGDGTWSEEVIHAFSGSDGFEPLGNLIFDSYGNLYGTTSGGGASQGGTVFKLSPAPASTWSLSTLYNFEPRVAFYPTAGLASDSHGNLYGTTQSGGIYNCPGDCGTIFRLALHGQDSWKEHVLHSFNGKPAAYPAASLVFDNAGNFYGTASGYNNGAVFKMQPTASGGWTFSLLHGFAADPASQPTAPLVLDNSGNLYGTTAYCGTNAGCDGVVFEIIP
jgi:uncharacterized repeat protein (TIGR03803 family)